MRSSRLALRGALLMTAAMTAGLAWCLWITKCVSTPPVAHLVFARPGVTSYMRADRSGPLKFSWKPLSGISPYLRQAVVIAEDDRFYSHNGYDIEAIKDAARVNLRRGRFSRGGSTITMQLARNLYLSPDKSLLRKFKELMIALKIERTLSKERILELYLNVVEWGGGIYGAEAASRHYFGKAAADLSRGEAAFLASILPRPRFYDRRRDAPSSQRRASVIQGRL
ncbi:MAG: monofunctional biosynthetic peptidoglycan transglycosylase [Proteobacteria bacterium]|nr:monofunctional biosynthetic peptidoglycan transglycosylase [Pseudomonadota bacterium]